MATRHPKTGPSHRQGVGPGQPKRDPEQSWFWSERWQQMEREADEDIRAGRVKRADNLEDLFTELESEG